jgi:hypothetical protein
MAKEPETRSCPKCRTKPAYVDVIRPNPHSKLIQLRCPKCGMAGPGCANRDEARRLWNRIQYKNPMASSAAKAKGSDFERVMCKRISVWLSGGESDDLIWRNKGQPNRSIKGRRRLEQFGDAHAIAGAAEWFMNRYNIEFKNVVELDLLEQVDKPKKKESLILTHWKQCRRDANDTDRRPLLIQKRSFGEPFIMCEMFLANSLDVPRSKRVDFVDPEGSDVTIFPFTLLEAKSVEDVKSEMCGSD